MRTRAVHFFSTHIAQSGQFIKHYRQSGTPLMPWAHWHILFHMNEIPFKWKTPLYPVMAILSGLVVSQIFATFQVFLANRALYHTLTTINAAGYVTIPNRQIMGRLQDMTTAVCGGFFLTLSVGAGISVATLAAAWVWDRVCRRNPIYLFPLLLLWAGFTAGIHWDGFSLFTTLYLAVIPPVVFTGALRWMPHVHKRCSNGFLHLIPIIVLGLLWAPQMKKGLFINIRNHLLLSNPAGEKIVDFYYQYTLYPAEVLKPLHRKLLKTCSLNPIAEGPQKNELRETLLIHDWIETEDMDVDLILKHSGNLLILEDGEGTAMEIPVNEFLSRPATALKRFSSRMDKHRIFRQLTFYSLLFAFPITLYILLYSLFFFFFRRRVSWGMASILSVTLCFSTALMLLMPLWWNHREEHPDPTRISRHKSILTSPHTLERYRLAKSLGLSENHETYEDLLKFLKDPSPIVVSAALFSLGQRGEKKAILEILRHLKISEHYYVQWYAYKALKTLGWKQKKDISS